MRTSVELQKSMAALLLTLPMLLLPAGLHAAVFTYPGAAPCNTTLQACVTGVAAGSTIQLATNSLIAEFVTVDKSLVMQPAAGFAPSVQSLFVIATTTSVDFTVQNLAGLHGFRALIGPGGGNLTVRLLNNVIDNTSTPFSPVEVSDGSAPGTYGTKTAIVTGNRISETGGPFGCGDAVVVIGTSTGFAATITGNDITVNNLSQCGGINAVVGAGQSATATIDRNLVHGVNFDLGIEVRNFGNNPGMPGGLITAQVSNNLVYGQNGNTGAPAGLVASADGNNAAMAVQLVNNTIADGRIGILVSARTDLGANITGGLFNNVVAFNSQAGIEIDNGLPGFSNSHNLIFANPSNFFTQGPVTISADPAFVNRAAADYRLSRFSPAIDVGLDSALPALFTLDLAGAPRRVGIIDLGAYEAQFAATAIPLLQGFDLALLIVLVGTAAIFAGRRRRAGT